MATFVLVHGAMHGGWCWRDVRRRLWRAGHIALTPTLTGQGDRAHLLSREVGVDTHVQDLSALFEFEDLTDVHLVLHSYAGILAGPLAEANTQRLASITYLGAFLADPGESVLDVEPTDVGERYLAMAAEHGAGWKVPANRTFLEQWGVVDSDVVAWVGPRLTDFPLRCVTDSVRFDPRPLSRIPQTYIRHVRPAMASLELSYQRAASRGMQLLDIESSHDAMIDVPSQLTEILIQLDEGRD